MASPSEEQRNPVETPTVKEMMHKIKRIQFFGRETPIILQNDNGPCPLLAICNILSLRNSLSMGADVAEVTEVSQEKLLSLVAERLIDSNSNVDNKDAGYVENQQQNIADAIDLLPRLATGIDVNIKFTRIDDFEFTRECAIFDLLDIPLYHGWIVDPQDSDTSSAIGSKSYNTLMGELVALDTQNMERDCKKNSEQDCVELTKTAGSTSANDTNVVGSAEETLSKNANGDNSTPNNHIDDLITFETAPEQDVISSLEADKESQDGQMNASVSDNQESKDGIEKPSSEELAKSDNISLSLSASDSSSSADQSTLKDDVTDGEKINVGEHTSHESRSSAPNAVLDQPVVESSSLIATADGSEPVSGEQSNLETSTTRNEGEAVISEQVDKDSISADDTKPRDETAVKHGELIRNFLKNSASQLTIYGLFSLQEGLKERELCVFFRNNHFNTMFKLEGELYILATDQGYINQPGLVWEKLNEVNGDTVFMNSNFKKFNAENHETHSWNEQNAMTNTADYLASIDNPAPGETGFNSDLQLAIALQQQEFEQQQQQQQQPPRPPPRVLPQSPTTSRSGLVVGPQNVHPSRPRYSSTSSRQDSKPTKDKDKCTVM